MIKKISRNIVRIDTEGKLFKMAMLSDIHWDNPHCNRDLLKQHLDYCVEKNIPVFINGDLFCLMQGRGDNRRSKNDIRPEHNNARYLDSIVETAVEWFSPYSNIIKIIGYGNHETSIIKFQETDLLQRFVDLLNYKNGTSVHTGGYSGWIWICSKARGNSKISSKIKYHHGAGGGGIVTKGAINLTRALQMYEGMDVFTMGHIHENWARDDVRETLATNKRPRSISKEVHLMVTGTYKNEYEDGYMGFHIERGRSARVIGGRILTIQFIRERKNGDEMKKLVGSRRFPI